MTGFSPSYISQVERNIANPSVSALQKMANALGVPIASFFDDGKSGASDSQIVVRKDERMTILYPRSRIKNQVLTPNLKREIVVLWISAPAGASSGTQSVQHGGEECAVVISGKMQVQVADQQHVLEEGDAIYIDRQVPHEWKNIGTEELEIVWIVAPSPF